MSAKFRKVEFIFNLLNSLQYRKKILVLSHFKFIFVEYKLWNFYANNLNSNIWYLLFSKSLKEKILNILYDLQKVISVISIEV